MQIDSGIRHLLILLTYDEGIVHQVLNVGTTSCCCSHVHFARKSPEKISYTLPYRSSFGLKLQMLPTFGSNFKSRSQTLPHFGSSFGMNSKQKSLAILFSSGLIGLKKPHARKLDKEWNNCRKQPFAKVDQHL
jgi:hypothetical protein